MNTKNVSKRSLIMSALALMICVSMLIGSTFAWFTDSVTSSGNLIKAGTLDIDLLLKTKRDTDYVSVTELPEKKAFDYDLWEPGYTEWVNAKVVNTGTLALKYTMRIVPDGEVSKLADVIDVYYKPAEVNLPASRPADLANAGLVKLGTLKQAIENESLFINDTLIPQAEDFATLALHMQESAGNEYQNLSIGSTFSLQILATQFTYEADSFDDQYDALADGTPDHAVFPVVTTTVSAPISTSGDTVVGNIESDKVQATIPDGAVADTVTSVSLIVESASDSDSVLTVKTDDGATAEYFDISLVDQNSNDVEIQDGKAIEVQKFIGKNLLVTEVNHRNTALTTNTSESEWYNYDSTTGILTLHVTSLSPFSLGYATKWTVLNCTDNSKIIVLDDNVLDKVYQLSEEAVTNLNKIDVDKLVNADVWFDTPAEQHSAIATFLIGGCQGYFSNYVEDAKLSYCVEGTTKEDIQTMMREYFDTFKYLVDHVEFYPQTGGIWGWAPWPMGISFDSDF
jgi:predicted ribosomally synthesized peptide with SipW-like signal peptide